MSNPLQAWVNRYRLLKAGALRPVRQAFRRRSLKGFGSQDAGIDYRAWLKRHDRLTNKDRLKIARRIERLNYKPRISIVVLPSSQRNELLARTIQSLRDQLYPNYDVCLIADDKSGNSVVAEPAGNRFRILIPDNGDNPLSAANRALHEISGEFVSFVHAGDELSAHALYLLVEHLNRFPAVDVLYSDEDCIDADGVRSNPYFKPDWNQDLLHSGDFLSRLALYRTASVRRLGGLRPDFGESAFYDLALRVTESLSGFRVHHLPEVLYHRRAVTEPDFSNGNRRVRALEEHLERLSIKAKVTPSPAGFCRVQYPLQRPYPLVSLIIATRDRADLLRQIVNGVLTTTVYAPLELIIVNNQSTDRATLEYLEELEKQSHISVLSYDRAFNFSAINNYAARAAKGEVLGFLNNDLRIISDDWLREMVSQVMRPGVGAVGAKLYYPDDSIQHAGIIVGLGNLAGYVHRHAPRDEAGHGGRLQRVQDCSAVTAACMVVKRNVFEEVGGFDEVNLPVAYNDVDLCLRIRELGYRILWTPYAELYHLESASRASDYSREERSRYERECAYLKSRWQTELERDRFYNPNLTIESEDFALAWPPRVGKPWNG